MTKREKLRELRARLVAAFLADPTHVSLGMLCLFLAAQFTMKALSHTTLLPEWLAFGWAAGLGIAGVGKIVAPFLAVIPEREDDARGIILGASILAGTCWATIAFATLSLGVGASLGALIAVALAVGAFGRAAAIRRSVRAVDTHARSEDAAA